MHREREPVTQSMISVDPDDELRLADIWQMLAGRPAWVLGLPLLCALAAIGFLLLASPRWESTSVIQVGQVGQTGVGEGAALIESPARTIERLKLDSFKDDVLTRLGLPLDTGDSGTRLFRRSIQLRQIPSTDLIELKVRGESPEDAKKYAAAVVTHLSSVHQRIAQPSIDRLRAALANTEADLRHRADERDVLTSRMAMGRQIDPSDRFAETVLLSSLLAAATQDIREIKLRILRLEEQLSPARTYPTSLIDQTSVPMEPAYPRPTLTLVLAVIGGLGAGAVVALVLGLRKPDEKRTEPS